MEEVNEFKYLGTVLCKYGMMEGEVRERTVKGRQVIGSLERIMKGRNVSMEVKKGIRNSIILPTDICIRDMDMESSTAGANEGNGNELNQRCMWKIEMGIGEQ